MAYTDGVTYTAEARRDEEASKQYIMFNNSTTIMSL